MGRHDVYWLVFRIFVLSKIMIVFKYIYLLSTFLGVYTCYCAAGGWVGAASLNAFLRLMLAFIFAYFLY